MDEGKKKEEQKKEQPGEEQQKEKAQAKEPEKITLAELKETLQRVQADFENYRKRVEKDKEEFSKCASACLIRDILPILDNFEIALKNTAEHEAFVKGIEMIYSQLFSLLESEGLKPIASEGKKFDPYFHEALLQEESDKEGGTVIEEFQKGYTLNNHILRHSKVKISKGKKKEVQDDKHNKGHAD